MNKIYKVIWSKVKNQYVVVSELAHSSGKQIRTSRSSIRSRIAALVVCGAIAAFGVLPMNLASADNIHINIDNVNSFANGNGTTVTETKDSHKDDITISFGVNTGDGLTVDGENNVVIDLASGKGLDFYNDKIGIKLANKSGLTFINGGLSIDENLTKNITNLQSATINGGNVDENGNINLTHTENDITTQVTSIDGLKDYALKDKQYITKDKSGATILTLQDQYDPNNTKDVKIDGLVTYNNGTKNGEVTGIDYGNIRLAGEIVKDPKTGKETNIGTRITNLKDGWIDEKSTDAVNGSQLYNVDQKVNAGWKANVINGQTQSKINIRPNGKDEVGKDTLSFIAGDNVTLTAIDNSIKIGTDLKDLNVEDTNAVLYDKDIDGNVDKGSITLAGGENGTQIHNLADGDLSATSKDAVNGSQLIGKTGDLQYNTDNHYVTNDENLTVSIGKLDDQVFTNTTNITELQGATINGGNVDENGNINLTHTENDITTQVTSIDGLKDYALKDKQYITKDKSGATILTLQDQYDPNNTKDVKIDGLVTYNNGTKNGEVTGIDYGNIRLAGEIVKDPKTGKETNIGTRITNLKDGWIDEKSTDAVNGSQLYAIQQEAGKHTIVTVNGGTSAPEPQEGQAEGMYSEDGNLQLKQTVNDGQTAYDIKLNSVLTLDSNGADNNKVVLDGNNGTISATNTVKKSQGQGPGRTTTNEFIFNNEGATFTNIIEKGYHDPIISTTKINGGTITTDTVKGLNNTTIDYEGFAKEGKAATEEQLKDVYDGSVKYWKKQDGTYDKSFIQLEGGEKGTTITHLKDGVVAEHSTEAINGSQLWETQQQIKDVETTASKHTIVSTTEDSNLTVKNVAEKGEADNYQVTLNDDIILGDYFNNGDGVLISGKSGTISATNSITVGEDQGLVIDGQKKTVQGLSNTTWTGTTETPNRAATEGQLQSAYDGSVKYWKKQDGTYDKSFIQLEGGEKGTTITHLKDGVVAEYSTEAINGSQLWETQQQIKDVETTANKHTIVSTTEDSNLTVENVAEKGEAANYQVALKDDITLKGDNSSIELNGTKGTIQVNQETAEGTNFTNINGNVVSIGYTNSEGIENAIVIDGGKGTITGLSNTTWDDELAKQVADSEELQGTAATQGQLQQAVSEVSGIVNKGWTAKAGDNDGEINITPGDTLNFEGDGNITVSATKESNELKFGLNDNITLGDKAGQKTSTSLTLYTDPSPIKDKDGNYVFNKEGETVTGYVPESYIDDQGRVDDFVSTHGGFMMYATDTSGQGVFGITTDGMVHAKDVISYMPNPDSNSGDKILKYSLNDIGDIVTQIAHGKFTSGNNATGMEYTLISDFTGETDKENPFVAVDENGNPTERTIGLAVRQDGAVVVGAVVDSKGVMSNETGIRINDADTETGGGKDTITGLSNTDWRPAAIRDSISTFGTENDDDSKAKIEASKAATQGQLDAMYDTVVGYDINESKTGIDYSTITLKGTPYGSTKDGNGSHEGGTLITNVAYAVTDTDSDKYNGSAAVNVDLLKDTVADVTSQASNSDRYLTSGKLDGNTLSLTVSDLNGYNNVITIGNIASKDDISNINKEITNINNQITNIKNQIGGGTGTGGNNNTTITGGKINDDGTISLDKNNGEPSITLEGQLTGSSVIQDGTKFDGESGTLTIMTQNDYGKDKVQTPITVEGIASKDDIEAVNDTIGATSKEDLKDKYKDTEYLKDENGETVETLADADIALDHAVQGLVTNDKYLNSRIDNVEKRLGDVEQRIDKVGAMAAAIANLRTMGFDPEAPTEIAVGVGQYKSETGLAIGVFHYPNQDFMLSASLSTSGDEVMGGIGATWRIGRKTAAEKAKDEEKRILAKAEEIKQAAKRAEVKAQADRHAKLLAEREAKGESIRPIENKVEQTQEQA